MASNPADRLIVSSGATPSFSLGCMANSHEPLPRERGAQSFAIDRPLTARRRSAQSYRNDLRYCEVMELELLPEDRHHEAVEFLTSVFPGSHDAPFLDPALRHWKYYAPHPFSKQTRCYVYRDGKGSSRMAASVPWNTIGNRAATSFQVIDWAGAARCPGAGFLLFRALWPQFDSYLGIGGSDDAKKVMRRIPKIRPGPAMAQFAYPLRPWGQLMSSAWSWKSPVKWVRGWKWRLARKRPQLDKWKAVPVEHWSDADAALLVPVSEGLYSRCAVRLAW